MIYEQIMQTQYFQDTYSKIEDLKKEFPVNHGFIHVDHVINNSKKLAKIFKLNEQQTNLLLIAAALHDIGYLSGRDEHPQNGAILTKEFLTGKYNLSSDEIDQICNAISHHGCKNENECTDILSLCLILADKMDFVSSRYSDDTEKYPNVIPFKKISKVVPEFDGKTFTMKIILSDCTSEEIISYKNLHYFKKLEKVFENIEKSQNFKCKLNFANKNLNEKNK